LQTCVSIGVAIFPNDGSDVDTLLVNADAALYRAKAEGRGSVRFFEADMDRQLRERLALQQDLRSAEALIRWRYTTSHRRGLMARSSDSRR
jgi:predicted signal transduction protein with EAL and GGDEF domain